MNKMNEINNRLWKAMLVKRLTESIIGDRITKDEVLDILSQFDIQLDNEIRSKVLG